MPFSFFVHNLDLCKAACRFLFLNSSSIFFLVSINCFLFGLVIYFCMPFGLWVTVRLWAAFCVCVCEMNASLLKKKFWVRLLTNHLSEAVSCIFVCVCIWNECQPLKKKLGVRLLTNHLYDILQKWSYVHWKFIL